jgi:hypothetical protein
MAPLNDIDLAWMDTEDNKMIVHALTPEKIFYNSLDEAAQMKWAAELKTFSYSLVERDISTIISITRARSKYL